MDVEKFISEIVNQLQMGTRQTRDGSHLLETNISKHLEETFSKTLDSLEKQVKNVMSQTDITDAVDNFRNNLNKFNVSDADDLAKEYEKKLTKERDNEIKLIQEYTKNRTKVEKEYRENLRKQAKENIFRGLTNGRSDKYARVGQSISEFGASMKNIGGSGIFGKFGGSLTKVGGLLTKFAGPIGIVMTAFDFATAAVKKFGEVLNAINEYEIKQVEFDKSLLTAEVDKSKQELRLTNEINKENLNYFYELQKRNLEVESEIAKTARQLSADNYAKSIKISTGSITDGIAQSAYQAASAAIEAGGAFLINSSKAETSRSKEASTNKARSVANESTLKNITEDIKTASVEYTNTTESIKQSRVNFEAENKGKTNWQRETKGQFINGETLIGKEENDPTINYMSTQERRYGDGEGGFFSGLTGFVSGGIESSVKNALGQRSLHELQMAEGDFVRYQRQATQELSVLQIKNENEIANIKASNESELFNIRQDYEQSIYEAETNAAKDIAKTYLDLAYKQFEKFQEFDKAIIDAGVSIGIVNRNSTTKYFDMMTNRMPNIFRDWGKSFEDIVKLQQGYSDATGRSISLSNRDIENSFGLSILTQDQSVTDELNADMQIFNMSIADSSQMFGEVLDNARKLGLSTKKTGKDLVRDMKLANKYEFKGGKKALAEMSVWASKVRFDMSELQSLIEKQISSLEDVITNSASIQVLGGNFATQMGNPLKNAYLGFMDPEQLAKNQNEALRGIGFFNSETGKTEIGIADQQRLKAYSDATGISMENLRKQIFQMTQGEVVENALTSANRNSYSQKQIELLQQQAHYSNGEWKVTLRSGEEKNINDVSQSDFADLLPTEEAMYDLTKEGVGYLKEMVSTKDKLAGETNAQQIELMQNNLNSYYAEYEGMLKQANDNFEKRKEEYERYIQMNFDLMLNSYKGYCETAAKGDEQIDEQMKKILKNANSITLTLEEVDRMFKEAVIKMNGNVSEPQTQTFNVKKIVEEGYEIKDGYISQNGSIARIDKNDQVLAAKQGGPIDKMLDMVQPRPMAYDSYVKERPYSGSSNNNDNGGKIEIAPIQISINGNIQVNGTNGSIDLTQQISNDPNFIRALTQMISLEVEKKVNGGRVTNPLNRNLQY